MRRKQIDIFEKQYDVVVSDDKAKLYILEESIELPKGYTKVNPPVPQIYEDFIIIKDTVFDKKYFLEDIQEIWYKECTAPIFVNSKDSWNVIAPYKSEQFDWPKKED